MRQASGFACPHCGQDELADIVSNDLIHIIEFRCPKCEEIWAVEL